MDKMTKDSTLEVMGNKAEDSTWVEQEGSSPKTRMFTCHRLSISNRCFHKTHKIGNVGIMANVYSYIFAAFIFSCTVMLVNVTFDIVDTRGLHFKVAKFSLVCSFSNGTAKSKLPIFAFLCCGEFVKIPKRYERNYRFFLKNSVCMKHLGKKETFGCGSLQNY